MGHRIHIQSDEQHLAAIRVLHRLKGTWLGIGTAEEPVIVVTDEQFAALVAAGVVSPNGQQVKRRGSRKEWTHANRNGRQDRRRTQMITRASGGEAHVF